MAFLNKQIADALCTVITLGFAQRMGQNEGRVTFEYEDEGEANQYESVVRCFESKLVLIRVGRSRPQSDFPYILGTQPFDEARKDRFLENLNGWADKIRAMFLVANQQCLPPRGAYIGVQIFVNEAGDIVGDPSIYGPSSLSLHEPKYRSISQEEKLEIAIAYCKATMSTNVASLAVTRGLPTVDHPNFDTPYQAGRIFGSNHGMIRAMVNRVDDPDNCSSVFAEIALGDGTTKVSSCLPCALFMQSSGYPASSIHLGRGDNWRIPDSPSNSVLKNWKDYIRDCYEDGLKVFNPVINLAANNTTLGAMVERIIGQDTQEIPNLFLEALTFEGPFTARIIDTFKAAGIAV